jgi:hypothetical protein
MIMSSKVKCTECNAFDPRSRLNKDHTHCGGVEPPATEHECEGYTPKKGSVHAY